MNTSPKSNTRYWVILAVLFGSILAAYPIVGLFNPPREDRPEVSTDREYIEAGAARIDAFCSSDPDACD